MSSKKTTAAGIAPDIEILVSNTGGARPNGASASSIRNNLEKAFASKPAKLDIDVSSRSKEKIKNSLHNINVNANLAKGVSKNLQQQLNKIADGLKLNVQVEAVDNTSKGSKKSKVAATVPFEKFDGGTVSTRAMSASTANVTKQRVESLKKESEARIKNAAAIKDEKIATEEKLRALKAEKAQADANTAKQRERKAEIQANIAAKREETAVLEAEERARNKEIAAMEREDRAAADSAITISRFSEYLQKLKPDALNIYDEDITEILSLLSNGLPDSLSEAQNKIKIFKAEMKQLGYEGGNVFSYLEEKVRTFSVYLLSSALTMSAVSIFNNVVSSVKDLDAAFTDLKIVTGGTNKEVQELMTSYNQLAQELGSTTKEVASGATDWLRQGYTGSEAKELLKQSMTLSIVGDMDAESATTSLTAALKGLQLETEDASKVVDKFFTVDMAAATSAENLALALAKTAANAKLAGLSLDDIVAQLAVVSEVMQESGTVTGSTNCLVA